MNKLSLLTLFCFLCLSILAQTDLNVLEGGARPSFHTFYKELEDKLGNTLAIPISVVKGKTEGPTVTVVAGIHGFEYPPIIAAQELIQEIDATQLSGTLIIIPLANPPAFYRRSPFLNPQDHINLNRAFPGNKDGSITERMADFFTSEVIAITDVFIDMHGGDANEDLLPFICYYHNEAKPAETAKAKILCESSGFEYIVSYPYTLSDDQPALYAFKQAVQTGKIALSIECGKLGNVQDEAVILIKQGVVNMLEQMEMYPGTQSNNHKIIRLHEQHYIKSDEQGIFHSKFRSGDEVREGEIIGYIKNEFGATQAEILAPSSGIILYKIGTPPVNVGETIMCIAR